MYADSIKNIVNNIMESVVNIINSNSSPDKIKYADEVMSILDMSYKSQGGLKGISNIHDLMAIPFWKLIKKDGKIKVVILYKDKGYGRKLIALGTDSSIEAKDILRRELKYEFSRSFMEVSGSLLGFLKKNFPNELEKYKISVLDVEKILGKKVEPTSNGAYIRDIDGHKFEKIMLGTIGKNILF